MLKRIGLKFKFTLHLLINCYVFLLQENKDWNHLIQDAQRRGALVKTNQEHYQRDVNRILKLKPVVQRTTSFPQTKPVVVHTPPVEAPCRGINTLSVPPPRRPIAHPAVAVRQYNSRSLSVPPMSEKKMPSHVGPPSIPLASSGKLRDPRLARRCEVTRSNSTPPSSLHQSSDKNVSQSRVYQNFPPTSVTGVKRPSQPAHRDPRSSQLRNEGRDHDYRGHKDQEYKKRKVS